LRRTTGAAGSAFAEVRAGDIGAAVAGALDADSGVADSVARWARELRGRRCWMAGASRGGDEFAGRSAAAIAR
jgi:hypothetical protein